MRALLLSLILVALPACRDEGGGPEPSRSEPPVADPLPAAQRAYDEKDYARAADLFRQALDAEPGSATALLGRAWSLLEAARCRFEDERRLPPEQLEAADDAFAQAGRAISGPNEWRVLLGQGELHLLRGDVSFVQKGLEYEAVHDARAKDMFQRVLAFEGAPAARRSVEALYGLAWVASRGGDYIAVMRHTGTFLEQTGESKKLWRQAAERFPEDPERWKGKLASALQKEIPALILRVEAQMDPRFESADAAAEAGRLLDSARQLEALDATAGAMRAYRAYLDCANRLGLPAGHEGVRSARERIEALGD